MGSQGSLTRPVSAQQRRRARRAVAVLPRRTITAPVEAVWWWAAAAAAAKTPWTRPCLRLRSSIRSSRRPHSLRPYLWSSSSSSNWCSNNKIDTNNKETIIINSSNTEPVSTRYPTDTNLELKFGKGGEVKLFRLKKYVHLIKE